MYWLQRPPYLRWASAAVLIVAALAWDLRGTPTSMYPFAARPIGRGTVIGGEDVEWRQIQAGLWTSPSLDGAVAAVDVGEGEPITSATLTRPTTVPEGWVALPVDVGGHASAGAEVVLIVVDPPASIPGLVVRAQTGDRFALDFSPAVVAVPGERAVDVAVAAARGQIVAALSP